MLATAINLGVTANIVAEMFNTTATTPTIKKWFTSDCTTFPKNLNTLPNRYVAKTVIEYLEYLNDYKNTDNTIDLKSLVEYGTNFPTYTQGVHDIVLAVYVLKFFNMKVVLKTKYDVPQEKIVLFYLTVMLAFSGFFTSCTILNINKLHPELEVYDALADTIRSGGTIATIENIKQYLADQLVTHDDPQYYNFFAIIQLMYKLELYESDSNSLKRFFYQIVITSHYLRSNDLSFGYITLLSISERKSRFIPKPLRENTPYYKTIVSILGADK
jgi:hypothetical protein